MHRRLAHRAHRQRLAELLLESQLHVREGRHAENAVAIVAVGQFVALPPARGASCASIASSARAISASCARQPRPRFGQVAAPCAPSPSSSRNGVTESSDATPLSTSFRASCDRLLAAVQPARRGRDHLIGLLFGQDRCRTPCAAGAPRPRRPRGPSSARSSCARGTTPASTSERSRSIPALRAHHFRRFVSLRKRTTAHTRQKDGDHSSACNFNYTRASDACSTIRTGVLS